MNQLPIKYLPITERDDCDGLKQLLDEQPNFLITRGPRPHVAVGSNVKGQTGYHLLTGRAWGRDRRDWLLQPREPGAAHTRMRGDRLRAADIGRHLVGAARTLMCFV